MHRTIAKLSRSALALVIAGSLVLSGCTSETPTETTNQPAPTPAAEPPPADAAPVPALLEANDQTWTPEELEDLLAPVALYPDDVLGGVLVAATNPQEVLDAGSWRLKNENLEGNALDDAAKQAGFTPPVRVLIQNPVVLDMMCSEFGWTQELGQAYVNDQAGVLDAIQRLRRQAQDAGNLVSSDKMLVETEVEAGEQAIVLSSPDPEVVYVPQYDPERVYYTVEDDDDDDGVGTGTVVATALLAFGAGLALGAIFDDDDDDWYDDDYYYPRYYGPPMPYYAHYPYRPAYAGYYPARGYVRPPTYRYSYHNTTIVRRDVDHYWTRYDDRVYRRHDGRVRVSPITKAKPNRPELQYLNQKSKRGPKHRAPAVAEERDRYKVKKQETATYAAKRRKKQERRAADVDRDRNRDRDRGKDRDRAGGREKGGGGGADRDRDRGDRGGKAGGGNRDRSKAGGGGGNRDRSKAGGGGGNRDRSKAGGGNKGGGGRSGGGGGRRRG